MNRIDTIKAVFTYATAAFIAIGGLFCLVFVEMPPDKLAIVAGLVGGATVFLWGQETATRATRAAASAAAGNGTMH